MAIFSCKINSVCVCDVTPESHIETGNSYCPICVHIGQPDSQGMVFLPFFGFCDKDDEEVKHLTPIPKEIQEPDYYFSFEKATDEVLPVTHPDGSVTSEVVPF